MPTRAIPAGSRPAPCSPIPARAPAAAAAMAVAAAMAAAVAAAATEHDAVRGVATIRGELGRRLRNSRAPIRAQDLLDHSGEFLAGDLLYVTTRGRDGGQSTLGIGRAAVDAAALDRCAGDVVVVGALELLWRDGPVGDGE